MHPQANDFLLWCNAHISSSAMEKLKTSLCDCQCLYGENANDMLLRETVKCT